MMADNQDDFVTKKEFYIVIAIVIGFTLIVSLIVFWPTRVPLTTDERHQEIQK